MRFRLGGPRLEPTVRRQLGIARGERVLGWGRQISPEGDLPAVATERGLYGTGLGARIDWVQVSRAGWDDPYLDLVLVDGRSQRLDLREAGGLPDAVRTMVTDSVIVTERLDLGGGAGASAVARRGSGDGQIHWSVAFDPGLDGTDPALRARADEALAALRATLGI
ncbi:MAG: hypothetical protein KGP12_03050 [Actinomycetales bacterium]|nr:hypothetical protein [Actinomycetales bacterium]